MSGHGAGTETPGRRPARPRRSVIAVLLVVAAVLLIAAERQARHLSARHRLPTGEAEWIWIPDRLTHAAPRACWVVRDFELPRVPERAEILITAEEGYLLHVNGRRVGSNRHREGAPLDRYPVSPLLAEGANRIAVELRSGRGSGGLLAALVDGTSGVPLLTTDRTWRVFERSHPGILQGWLPQEEGEPARSWGLPPTGRWGRPRESVARPPFSEVAGLPWERRLLPPRRLLTGAAVASPDPRARGWRRVAPDLPYRGPQAAAPSAAATLYDWGREVTGYLVLALDRHGPSAAGLLYTGTGEPPEPRTGGADTTVVGMPGAVVWRDALPRRFRYVTVLGVGSLTGAWVEEVEPRWLAELPSSSSPAPRGVFGLEPPPLRTPIEDEVRSQLESFADQTGGEGL